MVRQTCCVASGIRLLSFRRFLEMHEAARHAIDSRCLPVFYHYSDPSRRHAANRFGNPQVSLASCTPVQIDGVHRLKISAQQALAAQAMPYRLLPYVHVA